MGAATLGLGAIPLASWRAFGQSKNMQVPYAPTPLRLGPYELLQKLATGGMAEIYIARREGPHGFSKRIALKRILPQLAADPEFVAMFIDEARLCAQLTHPNLVQVFDFGEETAELYMAMELVEGTTAAKVVRAAARKEEPFPPRSRSTLRCRLVAGSRTRTRPATKTDARSASSIATCPRATFSSAARGAVKLGDFGIARAAEFDRRTDQGQLKGKLGLHVARASHRARARRQERSVHRGDRARRAPDRAPALFRVARDGRAREDPRRRLGVLERHGGHIAPDIKRCSHARSLAGGTTASRRPARTSTRSKRSCAADVSP